MKNIYLAVGFSAIASMACAQAVNSIALFDDSFTASIGAVSINEATPNYGVYWGTYADGIFTPIAGAVFSSDNDGYLGDPFGVMEISVYGALANNNTLAVGTQLYLALTEVAYGENYAAGLNEAILMDPTWVAPTFDAFAADGFQVSFTAQTTAVKGIYSYNGGNETINLQAVPEPSAFAAIAGLAVLGGVATRRRRSA